MFEVGQSVIVVHDNGETESGVIVLMFAAVAFIKVDGGTIIAPLSNLKESN